MSQTRTSRRETLADCWRILLGSLGLGIYRQRLKRSRDFHGDNKIPLGRFALLDTDQAARLIFSFSRQIIASIDL
jgi:hypothetical protein